MFWGFIKKTQKKTTLNQKYFTIKSCHVSLKEKIHKEILHCPSIKVNGSPQMEIILKENGALRW